jgi:hypothetical protein
MVRMAYDKLDKNRDGTVTLEDIQLAYDVSFHPEVSYSCLSLVKSMCSLKMEGKRKMRF